MLDINRVTLIRSYISCFNESYFSRAVLTRRSNKIPSARFPHYYDIEVTIEWAVVSQNSGTCMGGTRRGANIGGILGESDPC